MTAGATGAAVRILLCDTFGGGGTIVGVEFKVGEVRLLERETSGAGGMTPAVKVFDLRLPVSFSSGEGAITFIAIAGGVGAVRVERKPSDGGGPALGLNASRLATEASECGKFTLGASTTFSLGLSPRATRMVCVRW